MTNNSVQEIIDAIEKARSFVITAHVSPDGDASCSSLALALMLRAKGKNVRLAIPLNDLGAPGVLPMFASFVDVTEIEKPDYLICLDSATVPRIAIPSLRDKVGIWPTINIDHHATNDMYGDLNYVLGDWSSTGEVIYDIAMTAGWTIDRDVAEALWVAIVTDTGRFAYSCTRPSTLRCAADLLSRGVRAPWLNDELFCFRERKEVEIHRRAENSLETWFDGKVAVISLEADDYTETGCTKSSTENFSDIPRSVRGTMLSIFFYRLPDDPKTHLSIRARPPFSAAAFAARLGGGGHELAAGATLELPMVEAKALARKTMIDVFDLQGDDDA